MEKLWKIVRYLVFPVFLFGKTQTFINAVATLATPMHNDQTARFSLLSS